MFINKLLTRRSMLRLGLGTLASVGACGKSQFLHQTNSVRALDRSARDFTVVGDIPLKERAAAKGLIYGAAAKKVELTDAEFTNSFIQECDLIVPKWEFRWNWLNPSPDKFNFTAADWFVEWARNHNMLLRGHTLIYENSTPKWFGTHVSHQNAEQVMVNYIQTVAGRYAGQLHSWDVVNEAINPEEGRLDGLRNTQWLRLLGPDYIELAFHAAAAADPQALLVYNEGSIDADTEDGELRRVAVLKLLERLKSKNTPIHALGMQGHIWRSYELNPKKLRAFIRDVVDLDLKIMITELDVLDKHLRQKKLQVRDRIIAKTYQEYLSVVLDEPAVIAVITWGLSDRYSWYNQQGCEKALPKKCKSRPLPLDGQLNRKLAWNAIANAFDNAPSR
jgi:endo-1,4-beta-xylanase